MSDYGIGTIIVPSDFHLANGVSISPNDGSILATGLSLGTGEGGAQFQDGTFAIANKGGGANNANIKVYQPNGLVLLATVALFAEAQWGNFSPIASDFQSTFYGSCKFTGGGASQVKSFTKTGTVGGTTWTLDVNDIQGLGVTDDNALFIYSEIPRNRPIKTWNVPGNVAGTTLVAADANITFGEDLIVIPNTGTFVTLAKDDGAGGAWFARIYRISDGTLLMNHPLGLAVDLTGDPARLSLDVLAPSDVFWVRTFNDASGLTSMFTKIRIADDTVVTQFTVASDPDGTNPNAVPDSCPFFVWSGFSNTLKTLVPPGFPFPGPPGPIGTPGTVAFPATSGFPAVIRDPLRRLRRAPHLSNEQLRMFYDRFQLDIEAGAVREVDEPFYYTLRWSDDGGHTWSNYHRITADKLGQDKFRALWRRLGRSRDRVFEVTDSNPGKSVLLDAFLRLRPGITDEI